jgi:hypothetical protein
MNKNWLEEKSNSGEGWRIKQFSKV